MSVAEAVEAYDRSIVNIFRSLLFAEKKGVGTIKLCVMSFIVGHAVSTGQE